MNHSVAGFPSHEPPGLVSPSCGHPVQRLSGLEPRCRGGAADRRPRDAGVEERRQRDPPAAGEGAGRAAPEGQERAHGVEHRAHHRRLLDGGRGPGRPRGDTGRGGSGGRQPGARAGLRRHPPLLGLGRPGHHAQRALSPSGRRDAVDGPAAGDLRDPHPRRGAVGREGGGHRQRLDRLHPPFSGPVGVEPLVRRARHRPGLLPVQGVRRACPPPGCPSCWTAGRSSPS